MEEKAENKEMSFFSFKRLGIFTAEDKVYT